MQVFMDTLAQVLEIVTRGQSIRIFVSGDFNINFNLCSREEAALVDLFASYGLESQVFEPTRIYGESSTCIDNINTKINMRFSRTTVLD
jgi:hypothetical protein